MAATLRWHFGQSSLVMVILSAVVSDMVFQASPLALQRGADGSHGVSIFVLGFYNALAAIVGVYLISKFKTTVVQPDRSEIDNPSHYDATPAPLLWTIVKFIFAAGLLYVAFSMLAGLFRYCC
jgi:hypothetical protein